MSNVLFYADPGPRLDWRHWQVGAPGNEPNTLPPSHIQPVVDNPWAALNEFLEAFSRTIRALPGLPILQFSSRIAVAEDRLAELERWADKEGLEVEVATAQIPEPSSDTCIRLGYLQLDQGAAYPEDSLMTSGLHRVGDCLLIRRGAVIHDSVLPTLAAGINLREPAGLDALYVYREPTFLRPYTVVAPDQVNQPHRVDRL